MFEGNEQNDTNLNGSSSNDKFTGTSFGGESEFEKDLGFNNSPSSPTGGSEPKPFSQAFQEKGDANQEVKKEKVVKKEKDNTSPQKPETSKGDLTTEEYAKTIKDYNEGDIIKGKVVSTGKNILVDIEYKAEGIIEPEEIYSKESLSIGDIISVYIIKLENKEGHPVLSKRIADIEMTWTELHDSYKNKKNLEGKIISAVKGGLVIEYKMIRGFIPASHVLKNSDEDLTTFVGKTLPIRILEIDRKRKKIVFSHKLAAISEAKSSIQEFWKEIEAGQVRKGIVSSIKKFGAFIDLGQGVEGLVHISEMSWKRIVKPSDILKVGDTVEVFVLGVDNENKKISLGMKQLQQDPWVNVDKKYKVGQLVTGKICRLVSFGAFVELENGLEGLIHISELSDKKIEKPEEVVKEGNLVQAKILRIISEEQRIGLSIKATIEPDDKQELNKYQEEEQRNRKEVTIGDIMNNNVQTP